MERISTSWSPAFCLFREFDFSLSIALIGNVLWLVCDMRPQSCSSVVHELHLRFGRVYETPLDNRSSAVRSPSAAFGRSSDEDHRPAHYRELLQRAGWR